MPAHKLFTEDGTTVDEDELLEFKDVVGELLVIGESFTSPQSSRLPDIGSPSTSSTTASPVSPNSELEEETACSVSGFDSSEGS